MRKFLGLIIQLTDETDTLMVVSVYMSKKLHYMH
jgi:hypothetical protein